MDIMLKIIFLIYWGVKTIFIVLTDRNNLREKLVIRVARLVYKAKHNKNVKNAIIFWPITLLFQLIAITSSVFLHNLNLHFSAFIGLVFTELVIFFEYVIMAAMTWSLLIRSLKKLIKLVIDFLGILLPSIVVYWIDPNLKIPFDWLIFILFTIFIDPILLYKIFEKIGNVKIYKLKIKTILLFIITIIAWYFVSDKDLLKTLLNLITK